ASPTQSDARSADGGSASPTAAWCSARTRYMLARQVWYRGRRSSTASDPDMSDPILIYGATGFSGRLATRACLAAGLRRLLAGRSPGALAAAAVGDGLEQRTFDLVDPSRLDAALDGVRVVLNMAGPYSSTARAMVEACLRTGTHYLDITGETQVIEDLAS